MNLFVWIDDLKFDNYSMISCRGRSYSRRSNLCAMSKQTTPKHQRAGFLSESNKTRPLGRTWSSPRNSLRWFNSPVKSMNNFFPKFLLTYTYRPEVAMSKSIFSGQTGEVFFKWIDFCF